MRIHGYDPVKVLPMREALTQIGFEELLSPQDVDRAFSVAEGTMLLVVNSVCGCAAGSARPGLRQALERGPRPDRLATVFAGMELEAVERARSHFAGYEPSSPQMGLFRDGKLVFMLERKDIEGRSADEIATDLTRVFADHCAPAS
ncbi:MAG: BrxA/BrxB family bacilliredoxin [Gemmatimonadota bacterium]|nr:MAG: BrxA/BrxB family bacilliredoxin [Gemmatimonadota bacterium]